MNPIAMAVILAVTLSIFVWSAFRRFQLITHGAPEPSFDLTRAGEIPARVKLFVEYWLGQRKMPANEKYRVAGLAHVGIFYGFLILGLNTTLLWVRGFDPTFDVFGLMGRGTLLGDGYSFTKEVFAALVLLGVLVFVYYRVVAKNQRMTLGVEGLIILGIIGTMMIADFVYTGAWLALEAAAAGTAAHFHPAEPIGSALAVAFDGMDEGTLRVLAHVGFWWHATFPLIFLNLLPFSKHFHVITAVPNVFATQLGPVGRLPNVVDIEGKVEREEPIGIAKITDLSWKGMLDLYTCTECGRCSDNCPAYTTGKKLSPKHLTLALRDHLYASEGRLTGDTGIADPLAKKSASDDGEPKREVLHTTPAAPEGGYFTTGADVELLPNIIDPDVIWACTSCRACEEQCPVMITYVDKIVGMRRDQVMIKNEFPPQLQKPFNGIETNGNPWNISAGDRADWADGLDIPTVETRPDAAVLYWVGCAASFDDRAKKVARSFAKLMKHAGVDFAILGTEETCTGDPARRAGNEYLFQMVAAANVEVMNNYNVGKKKVVTACPHCFNTLKNEYPDFGGQYDVVHHTDFLYALIQEGKLKPEKKIASGPVAFHDSCYLGRYNQVYDAPRQILQSIPGLELREVEYWNKSKGLCCGAGGAQMFMEEQHSPERVNTKRTLQLLKTGAETLATGCPFCMVMITDGLKAENKEDQIGQKDVAELLAESVGVGALETAEAAQ